MKDTYFVTDACHEQLLASKNLQPLRSLCING